MKINYIVRSKVKGQPATVYLRYSESREVGFELKTPEKIYPEHWSGKQDKWFKSGLHYNSVFTEQSKIDIEKRLTELKMFITDHRVKLKQNVTRQWLQVIIDKFYNRIEGGETLNDYLKRYVEEMRSGVRLKDGNKRYTTHTIRNYENLLVLLSEYQGIYSENRVKYHEKNNMPLRRKKLINFNDITTDFCGNLAKLCIERDYKPNSISIMIYRLKTIMRASFEEGLHTNNEFTRKGFSGGRVQEVDDIYLTEDEIKKLFKLDLSYDKEREAVRDVFLCGCYTAQRYSDFSNYRKVNTDQGRMLLGFRQVKTGEKCSIPIRPEFNFILSKYNYTLPEVAYHTISTKIKSICKEAGITDMVEWEDYEGGFRVKKQSPKYELVTTHTARRSGATNMKLAKMDNRDIMMIGGWKTEAHMLKYIKLSQEETAMSLMDNPFFRGNTLSIAK